MSTRTSFSRTITRSAALLVGAVTAGIVGLPAAHATDTTVRLTLLPGQSAPIGSVVSNTDVTPVPTCDPGVSVTFDATMAGTATVARDATLGLYTCTVDYQIDGQSTGLLEHVLVTVGPGLSIDDVTMDEGTPLTIDLVQPHGIPTAPNFATFTVTLSAPSTNTVGVRVTTSNGTASTSDYGAVDTTLTFAPGETSKPVSVSIDADFNSEPDETYSVSLSKPTNALIADGEGIGTILNDDGPFSAP